MILDDDQREADAFVARLIASLQAEYQTLSRPAKGLAIRALHDRFADKLNLDCSSAKKRERDAERRRMKREVAEALEQAERIQEMCGEVPERGEEFASSVLDGVTEVAATIQEQQRVTADQQRAFDNWESGISRWLR